MIRLQELKIVFGHGRRTEGQTDVEVEIVIQIDLKTKRLGQLKVAYAFSQI